MRFAFVLFKYFPFGGLQRDMISIAQVALARGHQVSVLCADWEGDVPAGLKVERLSARGFSNAKKMRDFAEQCAGFLKGEHFDLVVGFNKFSGLDVYYAADSCFAAKAFEEKSWFYRLTARAKTYLAFERAVFSKDSATEILEISTAERDRYQRHYQTPSNRFHGLPPGIWPQHRKALRPDEYGQGVRNKLGIDQNTLVLLAIGSGFRTKGLDRSIRLLADWPKSERELLLLVAGQDKADAFIKLARELGVENKVRFLGGRDDIPDLLQAADLLLHPARKENTGNVLLEAMVAGRPVIATDVCGYSHYIQEANMGVVMPSPFQRGEYLNALRTISRQDPSQWRERGAQFAARDELYARSDCAVDLLEQFVANKTATPKVARQ